MKFLLGLVLTGIQTKLVRLNKIKPIFINCINGIIQLNTNQGNIKLLYRKHQAKKILSFNHWSFGQIFRENSGFYKIFIFKKEKKEYYKKDKVYKFDKLKEN